MTICLAATAVIVRHLVLPLHFKGGRIATGVGTVMAISVAGILALVVWVVVVASTASCRWGLSWPPSRSGIGSASIRTYGGFYVLWALVMALLMAYTHRANIASGHTDGTQGRASMTSRSSEVIIGAAVGAHSRGAAWPERPTG